MSVVRIISLHKSHLMSFCVVWLFGLISLIFVLWSVHIKFNFQKLIKWRTLPDEINCKNSLNVFDICKLEWNMGQICGFWSFFVKFGWDLGGTRLGLWWYSGSTRVVPVPTEVLPKSHPQSPPSLNLVPSKSYPRQNLQKDARTWSRSKRRFFSYNQSI